MSIRTSRKARKRTLESKKTKKRAQFKPGARMKKIIAELHPELTPDQAVARAKFFYDFGCFPKDDLNIEKCRADMETARAESQKAKIEQQVKVDSMLSKTVSNQSQHHSSCHRHHCFHTYPGTYGGPRSDTYDPTTCCHCGISAPNPYENERR